MEEPFVPYIAEQHIGGKRALVLAPHPDDEVFGCAGAIMRHVTSGDNVRVIVVTDGCYPAKEGDVEAYREMREKESIVAGLVLGYGEPEFWGYPDRGLQYNKALVERIIEAIFDFDADTVYVPSVYEAHQDHRVVAMAAIEAVRRLTDQTVLVMYEVSTPLMPNKLLDISKLTERKSKAMQCFKSQLELRDYAKQMQALDVFRTYTLPDTVQAAEAYRVLSPQELNDPLNALANAAFDPEKAIDITSSDDQDHPMVSIIIRSIGRKELRQALSSVALQFYPTIEVIIVNAKGTAHPPVLDSCGRFPVRFIDSQEPIRRSRAANIGLDNAHGEYMMFLDDDDWIDSDHVSSLVDSLERRPSIKVAYSGVRSVGDQGDEPQMIFNEAFDPIRLLARNFIPIHAAMFSKEVLEQGCRFDEAFDIYEDWDFWLQVSQKNQFHHLDKITANYRVAEGSGLGVKDDQETVRKAAVNLYGKWRLLWTEDQLCGLMNHIQEQQLGDFQEVAHRNTAPQKEVLAQEQDETTGEDFHSRLFGGVLAELDQPNASPNHQVGVQKNGLSASSERLIAMKRYYGEQVDKLADQLAPMNQVLSDTVNQLSRAEQSIDDLYASRSWRITAVCRAVTTFARQASSGLRFPAGNITKAIWVYKAHGFVALIRKVATTLARHRATAPEVPVYSGYENLPIDREVVFPEANYPTVSIVIPVFNKYRYTINCLESVKTCSSNIGYEVIVVDDCSSDETLEVSTRVKNIQVIRNEANLGFVRSCNAGAKKAKGRYIVFLNNDTIVTENWLDALVNTFEESVNIGLVGAKLIYPDGKLQEAGGIIWADASGCNYGRDDDPRHPKYNYMRDVDYCSGACIAIERQQFMELGMFDEAYVPAYYEDTDLAFKVRKKGMRVVYQPVCTIVHFEGVTSGTSTSSGVKRYQVVNQGKFQGKWKKELIKQLPNSPENVERGKERNVTGRVLVIDALVPTPDQDSGSLRMYSLLRIMRDLSFKVTFIPDNLSWVEGYTGALQSAGIEVLYHPYVSSIEAYLGEYGEQFDIVWLSRANETEKHIDNIRKYCATARVIFDTVDLHFLREERQAESENKLLLRQMARRRKTQELTLMEKADVTLVVSPVEQQVLQKERPDLAVEIVSNIHSVVGCKNAFEERSGIVFIGGFNHPPNIDAVNYFVNDIFPLVRNELQGVKFFIVGSNPPKEITALASDDIIVTGFVPDISGCFEQCKLSVAPLRYGAGVKGKINTSMSYGVPVVTTQIGAEGMFLRNEQDVVIADNPEAFAQGIIRVYRDQKLWETLSANGMGNIEKYFSYEAATESIQNVFHPAVSGDTVRDDADSIKQA